MAKAIKKDAGEKLKEGAALKPDGSPHRPFPWADPYPASKLDEDGKTETVFIRATASQDIIVNGEMKKAGMVILPCNFAHQHAHVLSAPK